jgi:hypothetical protein
MDNMGGFILFIQFLGLFWIPAIIIPERFSGAGASIEFHLRSASFEPANIQVSWSFFPNLDPVGSVSMTCWIALPMRPLPPVTRTTAIMLMGD